MAFGETHVFLGKGYIVSVRHGASTSYTAVRQHWETAPYALAKGEDFVLYAILDFIVDNYMPVLEAIHDEVESIEDRVLAKPMTSGDIERLYMLRRDLFRLRNAIGPLVDVCGRSQQYGFTADSDGDAATCSETLPITSVRFRRRSTV